MVADDNVVIPTGILVVTDTTYRTKYKCNCVRFNTLCIISAGVKSFSLNSSPSIVHIKYESGISQESKVKVNCSKS